MHVADGPLDAAQIEHFLEHGFVKVERCFDTGYAGRVGVFEIVEIGEAVRAAIDKGASEQALAGLALAPEQTLYGEALRRVAAGETSLAEAQRVVGDLT